MVNRFGTYKAVNVARSADAQTPPVPASSGHQERVNVEMFRAIELLGRKLEKSEEDRDRLQRRLALIESAASVDEKTGKLYLPVVVEGQQAAADIVAKTPGWMTAATVMSSAIAILALSIVMMQPQVPALTPQQVAALNAITSTRFARIEDRPWTSIKPAETAPDTADDLALKALTQPQEQASAAPSSLAQPATDAAAAKTGTPPSLQIDGAPPMPASSLTAGADIAPDTSAQTAAAVDSMAVDPAAITPTTDTPTQAIASEAAPAPVTGNTVSDNTATDVTPPAPPAMPPEAQETAAIQPPATQSPSTGETPAVASDTLDAYPAQPALADAKAPPEKPAAKTAEKPQDAPAVKTAQKTEAETRSDKLVAGLDIGRDVMLPAAMSQLETRAMQGSPEAQHDLATAYASGKGLQQDYKRAAYWFAKAADGGVANAHYNLGVMFQQGLGVRKDLTKAIGWYEKAAELGHPEAMYNLGIAYIEGVGTKRNVDRGISYFKRAAQSGVAQAAFNLGVLYESGFGGAVDLASAERWYKEAAKKGHGEARAALERLQNKNVARNGGQNGEQAATAGTGNLTVADMVASPEDDEGTGEGDASPASESKPPVYKNDLIAKIQTGLIRQGLLPGKPSGIMDAQTEDAIRGWQKQAGLTPDGIPSIDLLGKINKTAPVKK